MSDEILRNQIDLEAFETDDQDSNNNIDYNNVISDDNSSKKTLIEEQAWIPL